jgi:hypothetical protein
MVAAIAVRARYQSLTSLPLTALPYTPIEVAANPSESGLERLVPCPTVGVQAFQGIWMPPGLHSPGAAHRGPGPAARYCSDDGAAVKAAIGPRISNPYAALAASS